MPIVGVISNVERWEVVRDESEMWKGNVSEKNSLVCLVYLLGAFQCNSLIWRYFAFPSLKTHLYVYWSCTTRLKLFFWFLSVPFACCCLCSCGMPAIWFFTIHPKWKQRKKNQKNLEKYKIKNYIIAALFNASSIFFPTNVIIFISFLFILNFAFCPMFKCFFLRWCGSES